MPSRARKPSLLFFKQILKMEGGVFSLFITLGHARLDYIKYWVSLQGTAILGPAGLGPTSRGKNSLIFLYFFQKEGGRV